MREVADNITTLHISEWGLWPEPMPRPGTKPEARSEALIIYLGELGVVRAAAPRKSCRVALAGNVR